MGDTSLDIGVQEALIPRLKRVIVLLHKIGEGLHAAQATDHSKNSAGSKLIASFLAKLATSMQPSSDPAAVTHSPGAADTVMAEPAEDEEEEVRLAVHPSSLQSFFLHILTVCRGVVGEVQMRF